MANRYHLMIDLETIGTSPGSVVTSIGAVFFDPYEDYSIEIPDDLPMFYRNINIDSCLKAGLKIDGSSLLWWMQQGQEAVDALTTPDPLPLAQVAKEFKNYYWNQKNNLADGNMIHVWAHGLTFDPPMWAVACESIGQKEPWMFRFCRDTRTLFDLAFDGGNPTAAGLGTKHNALHDSITQVIWVQEAYRKLKPQA